MGETVEYWSPEFVGNTPAGFSRSIIGWTVTADGRPLRAIAVDQIVYGDTRYDPQAWAGSTDFAYDSSGRAIGASNSLWVAVPNSAPFRLDCKDTYAGDALGRIFLATLDYAWAYITNALDNAFLFLPVPVTDLWHDQSFTLHPNGVVADYTITLSSSSFSSKSIRSYDERGVLRSAQPRRRTRSSIPSIATTRTAITWSESRREVRPISTISGLSTRPATWFAIR